MDKGDRTGVISLTLLASAMPWLAASKYLVGFLFLIGAFVFMLKALKDDTR